MTGRTVGDIYLEKVVTVTPATPVSEVADLMSSRRIHSLPVVEGDRIVGIVSRIDLVRTMIREG